MNKYYGWGLPADLSTHGFQIDRLIYIIHALMALLLVGWLIFLVIAIFRFRSRPGHRATYQANHFKAPTYIEVAIAILEIVLLVGFSFPIVYQTRAALPPKDQSLEIRVVAEQYAWNIHYAGADGVFGRMDPRLMSPINPLGLDPNDPAGKDDITTINQLHVPVGKPVIVRLSSKDVIHSFFLPVMRVKQDVIPGQVVPVWFQAREAGNFEIACAQLCGLGHYRMRGFFIVDKADQFKSWLDNLAPKPPAPVVAVMTPPVATTAVASPTATTVV